MQTSPNLRHFGEFGVFGMDVIRFGKSPHVWDWTNITFHRPVLGSDANQGYDFGRAPWNLESWGLAHGHATNTDHGLCIAPEDIHIPRSTPWGVFHSPRCTPDL